MGSYRDLRVWKESFDLSLDIDRLADQLPRKRAALADQIRRSSEGIPRSIAEGHGRSDADFARYLDIAEGSLHELETDIMRIGIRSLAPSKDVIDIERRIRHVQQLLSGLLRCLRPPTT
ncbi:CHP02436-containing protein [Gemmatirosa kalamazoonensis]|uniref:CHP02436-containing protein n=1 Tax=Gemmatirosa kalamazoonensis TaxID=861299 RepID=W0REL6_9BACT|nr:four helix bundle protein [Gemmatirosa kalamazoonensis]AHG87823.1 CHP02436-containing protein [Gemmatirosa kalamazoonensis]